MYSVNLGVLTRKGGCAPIWKNDFKKKKKEILPDTLGKMPVFDIVKDYWKKS